MIDLTNTTLEATGVDSDGDGNVGVDRPWAKEDSRSNVRWQRPARSWTSDFDDAIVSVELESARRLLDALAERHCRVAVVTFTSKPRILAQLGAPDAALAELERLRVPVDHSGTEARTAILRAGRLLDESPAGRGPRRRPTVVFMSDGAKTNRQQETVLRNAERAAEELAERGITLHALGFGLDEKEKPDHMGRIAAFGRGRYLHVDRPDEALALVAPHLGIADLPVINRAREGLRPRAVRSFPDGSFDGFVPLAPGENRIEFEVVLDDGRRARAGAACATSRRTRPAKRTTRCSKRCASAPRRPSWRANRRPARRAGRPSGDPRRAALSCPILPAP